MTTPDTTAATIEWHKFDGRFIAGLDQGMPNEPALIFRKYDGAVVKDLTPDSGGWTYVHVEFATKRHRSVSVKHGGLLGIIRDSEGTIVALTTQTPEEMHDAH